MSKYDYEVHEAATWFPMMEDEGLRSLSEDIKKRGQEDSIVLLDGKILDGRNRLAACKLAGVEPWTRDASASERADPVGYVLSQNLHRRHLTPSQVAMIGAKARGIYDEQAKERKAANGGNKAKAEAANLPAPVKQDSRDAVAAIVGVSGKTIDAATKVLKQGVPELVKAVESGAMAVSAAAKLADEPEEVQREEVKKPRERKKKEDVKVAAEECRSDDEEIPEDDPEEVPERVQQIVEALKVIKSTIRKHIKEKRYSSNEMNAIRQEMYNISVVLGRSQ